MFKSIEDPVNACRTVTWTGALRRAELIEEAEARAAAGPHERLLVDFRFTNLGMHYDEAWMVAQRLKGIAALASVPERAAVILPRDASPEERLVYHTLAAALPAKALLCTEFGEARAYLGLPSNTQDPRLAA